MDVKREQLFVDKISKSITKPVINEEDLRKYCRDRILERKEQEFIQNLRSLVDGIVYYKQDFIVKKLGGMNKTDFDTSLVFNESGLIKFDLVCRLKEGSMFGELALIYNQPRLATIISLCDADMATMDRRNFQRILGALSRQEDQKKIEFIEKEILKEKDYSSLAHTIGINFVKRTVQKNKTLFTQGEVPEKVFLIYSGQI